MANAAVFPVPVCAQPNMSFPVKATGIAFTCIGVGLAYPFSSIAFKIGSVIFKSGQCKNLRGNICKNPIFA